MKTNPFEKASGIEKRLKIFLWGASGVGKTILALQFPKPVMIDTEKGSELYGDQFDFDVIRTNDLERISEAVSHLKFEKHDYQTFILDPITLFWEGVVRKWSEMYLDGKAADKTHDGKYYDLQPRDWIQIKQEYNELLSDIISLDMNVVVTAREKPSYKDNAFMVSAGETFDAEKHTDYPFDVVLRLVLTDSGKHMVVVKKDRSNKLPKEPFESDFKVFEKAFGKESLGKAATPVKHASAEQQKKLETLVKELKISKTNLHKNLKQYGATCFIDLSRKNADIIIEKLEAAKEERANANG